MSDEKTALAPYTGGGMMATTSGLDHAQRVGKMLAASKLVPDTIKGDIATAATAVLMAEQMGVFPLTVAQNITSIKGKPGFNAKFKVAVAMASGVFTGPIRYTMTGAGDARECTATATLAASGDEVEETVTMQIANDMGWTQRNPIWRQIPDRMLKWRAAAWLIDMYAPHISLGLPTTEELRDIGDPEQPAPERIVLEPAGSRAEQVEALLAGDLPETVTEAPEVIEVGPEEPSLLTKVRALEEQLSPEAVGKARAESGLRLNVQTGRLGVEKLDAYLANLEYHLAAR